MTVELLRLMTPFVDRPLAQTDEHVAIAREDDAAAEVLRRPQIWLHAKDDLRPLQPGRGIAYQRRTRDGNLFVGLGERSDKPGRIQAQLLESALGKVVRLRPDGKAPDDNPFVGREDALPEIWSIGHRNIQSAALHPETGALWVVEHGARGGDEINIAEKGKDYGWPTIAYGIEYVGDKIGDGITQKEGMEQPIYYWDPVIAPSGMAFYTADLFGAWKGSLLVGSLVEEHVARLTLDGARVVGEERLIPGNGRVRDVRVGPDGAVYVLTDEDDGKLLKLTPRQ
jgi:glucose/arabinose dehydrogenase